MRGQERGRRHGGWADMLLEAPLSLRPLSRSSSRAGPVQDLLRYALSLLDPVWTGVLLWLTDTRLDALHVFYHS